MKHWRKKALAGAVAALLGSHSTYAINLPQTVNQTLTTNPEVLFRLDQRRSVDQDYEQARAGYYPSLDAVATYGWESTDSDTIDQRDDWGASAGVVANQMLFDGWAVSSEVDRQQARQNSSAFRYQGTASDFALNAVDAYLTLLLNQKKLSLTEESLQVHQDTYALVKERSDSGFGKQADLEQMETRLSRAEANLVAARSNLIDAKTTYQKVVGTLPADHLEDDKGREDLIPETLQATLERALQNHPTLKSAVSDVDAAFAQKEAADAFFYPRLDFEAGANWRELDNGERTNPTDYFARFMVNYNIFQGGADDARAKRTASQINEAKDVRDRTLRELEETTRLAWQAYKANKEQLDFLRENVDSADRTRKAYSDQFNIGQRTLLDLLDAEREYFDAQDDMWTAEKDYLFAQYRILNATGDLLTAMDVNLTDEANPVYDIDLDRGFESRIAVIEKEQEEREQAAEGQTEEPTDAPRGEPDIQEYKDPGGITKSSADPQSLAQTKQQTVDGAVAVAAVAQPQAYWAETAQPASPGGEAQDALRQDSTDLAETEVVGASSEAAAARSIQAPAGLSYESDQPLVSECLSIGPVGDHKAADAYAEQLRGEGLLAQVRPETGGQGSGQAKPTQHWVVVSGASSYSEAQVLEQALRDAGHKDTWLIGSGPMKHTISMGVFSMEKNAERLAMKLAQQGFGAQIRPKGGGAANAAVAATYWLDVTIPAQQKLEKGWSREHLAMSFPDLKLDQVVCSGIVTGTDEPIRAEQVAGNQKPASNAIGRY